MLKRKGIRLEDRSQNMNLDDELGFLAEVIIELFDDYLSRILTGLA